MVAAGGSRPSPGHWAGITLLLFIASRLLAQDAYVYIGQITASTVLIAWGTTAGVGSENSIGRDSASMGKASVTFGDGTLSTDRNWIEITGLKPDTSYEYSVAVGGRKIGGGSVRTYPERADRLTFFVIGDYGTGSTKQQAVADAMWREFQKRASSPDPVRFIITLGDNLYSDLNLGYVALRTGSEDQHWDRKFFRPYNELIRHIPFYPTLGNHDGNVSEKREDLQVYLDNFFFPGNKPARWYDFTYGGFAQFFALDSTELTTAGHTSPAYSPDGEQSKWLVREMASSSARWKIPYFHNPLFNAGPGHGASYGVLRHWFELFQKSGVRVVFAGHEHNFQFSEASEATGGARYIISGAGGELRTGDVRGNMARAHIEGWSAQRHFLVVEVNGSTMRVTPTAPEGMRVVDRNGKPVSMPLVISLP